MFKLVMSLVLVALTGFAAPPAVSGLAAPTAVSGVIRVDQAGYVPGESKQAYLMATAPATGLRFTVLDAKGRPVLSGDVAAKSRGSWNAAYPAVYPIDLSRLDRPGTYRIRVGGLVSPGFPVRSATDLYGEVVRDGVTFFRTQRDTAHRNDKSATVYATPHFAEEDVIADADLKRIGGPVDVAGGWYDAGDYLKMTHTTAYGAITLLAAARAMGPSAPAALDDEARQGIAWLDKAWDQRTRTLRLQVGIGSGNQAGTFTGDHDLWRLPAADDRNADHADRYAAAHRPVFDAAAPGKPISPNLAGRVAAAFALAAQQDAIRYPTRARAEVRAATSLYARADVKSPPKPLVTALPNEFYPEDTWHDDMELGATEIALALSRLGLPGGRAYVRDAAGYAHGYLAEETGDTFNLYDVSALAHADLITAIRQTGGPAGLALGRDRLIADLRRQVRTGADRAAKDVFHAGGVYTDFDVDSHTFGLIATEALYRAVADDSYAGFATQQRDWLLGANAWGSSFMVGVGSTFPRCPQHQIANLTGRPLTGAVVNGPNDPSLFADGLGDYLDDMVKCPAAGQDPFAAFTGHGSRFVDDVRAWQTDEPALDMTGSAILGAALQAGR
ncbi:glycoside hydrolase family 9 protein [Actinoplanes sp. KI2]|uniref:glycoside hydrolase family 9 protein n=1 Tax=Actinoplanes sp. KI2 TaxID=2983315 RepID=UPI0021D60C24|nr:glycoside hydrolase family 9 protein [Actinoplanes sp. KI2]MCU7724304.1 glycoside hydrolase family 9 protein [Actinoplanes sp. KI2]